jgi:hypothetical protein
MINYLPFVLIQRRWKEKRNDRLESPESVTSTSSDGSIHSVLSPPASPEILRRKADNQGVQSMNKAIIILQSHFRTFIARKEFAVIKKRRLPAKILAENSSALKLQACARMAVHRWRYNKLHKGVVKLQALVRGGNARMSWYITYAATIKIQVVARDLLMRKARLQFTMLEQRLVLLQARVRGAQVRMLHNNLRKSAICIQSTTRGYLVRGNYRKVILGVKRIQACIRGTQQKILYVSMLQSIIRIQNVARRIGKRPHDDIYLQIDHSLLPVDLTNNSSVVIIQAFVRKNNDYKRYLHLRQHLIKIQACTRGMLTRTLISKMKTSVIAIQAMVRGYFSLQEFKRSRFSIVFIQSWIRTVICQVRFAQAQVELDQYISSAEVIQRGWNRYKSSTSFAQFAHQELLFERAIVAVQKKWRLFRDISTTKAAAIKLQQWFRMRNARRKLELTNKIVYSRDFAATKLQSIIRASSARKSIKLSNQHASKIQQCYRRYLPKVRMAYADLIAAYRTDLRFRHELSAVVFLQSSVRRWLTYREMRSRTISVAKIQRCFRTWRIFVDDKEINGVCQENAKTNIGAIKIQSLVRANAVRNNIHSFNQCATKIQRCYSTFIQQARQESIRLRASYEVELSMQRKTSAVVVLQSRVRKWKCRREMLSMKMSEHQYAEQQYVSARAIQSIVRSWLCRKALASEKELVSAIELVKTNDQFTPMKLSAPEFISPRPRQSACPHTSHSKALTTLSSPVTKLEAEHYEKVSAEAIQKVTRGWFSRSRYLLLDSSAGKIQRCYRNHAVQTGNEAFKTSQTLVCNLVEMRQKLFRDMGREVGLGQSQSSVTIQACVRRYIAQNKALRLSQSALAIQTVWRRKKALRYVCPSMRYRKYYHGMSSFQAFSSKYISSQSVCESDLSAVEACDVSHNKRELLVCVMQSIWRGALVRKQQHLSNSAATSIQIAWTNYRATNSSLRAGLEFMKCNERMLKLQARCQKPHAQPIVDLHHLAESLQAMWRGLLERKQLKRINDAAGLIQNFWVRRRVSGSDHFNRHQEYQMFVSRMGSFQTYVRLSIAAKSVASVIKIQTWFRMHRAKTMYCSVVRSAKVIQAIVRMQIAKRFVYQIRRKKHCAIRLQSLVRASVVRCEQNKLMAAARIIQCRYRAFRDSCDFARFIRSVIILQRFSRMMLAKKIFNNRMNSCLLIQDVSRKFLIGCHLSMLSSKALIIQNAWFCYKSYCRPLQGKDAYDRFVGAIVSTQILSKRRSVCRYEAAKKIQVLYFSWKMRMSLAKVLNSVVQVQKMARGHLSRLEKERHYSALVLQRFFKSRLVGSESHVSSDESDDSDYLPDESTGGSSMESESFSESSSVTSDETEEDTLSSFVEATISDKELHSSALILQRFFRNVIRDQLENEVSAKNNDVPCNSDHLSSEFVKDHDIESLSSIDEHSLVTSRDSLSENNRPKPDESQCIVSDEERNDMGVEDESVVLISDELECLVPYNGSDHPNYIYPETTVDIGTIELGCLLRENENQINPSCEHAIILFQSKVRSILVRNKFSRFELASSKVQHAWKHYKSNSTFDCLRVNELKLLENAIISLQVKWRRHARDTKLRRDIAAINMQSLFRSWMERRAFLSLIKGVTRIQQLYISHLAKKESSMQMAATLVQALVRAWLCRLQLLLHSTYAIKIQQYSRGFLYKVRKQTLQMRLNYENDLRAQQKTTSAVMMQSIIRTWLCKTRLAMLAKLEKERAAIKIQSFARMYIAAACLSTVRILVKDGSTLTKKVIGTTASSLSEDLAATKIQTVCRRFLSQRNQAPNRILIEGAASKIQMVYRRHVNASHHLKKQAAIQIQSLARMRRSINHFANIRAASLKIQSYLRQHRSRTELRKKFSKVVVLQCWFRVLAAKSLLFSLEFEAAESNKTNLVERTSATTLQRFVRGYLVRQQLSTANHAARTIQEARRRSVTRLRNKLLQVFHMQSSSIDSRPVMRRSNSALLPKDRQRLNRVREIAPHLPRENGVFVEVILNSVAVVIQSEARRRLAIKEYKSKMSALDIIQRFGRRVNQQITKSEGIEEKIAKLPSQEHEEYIDSSSRAIRRRCISPSIIDVEDSVHFTRDDTRLNTPVVRIQSIFRGSNVRKEQSICNSSAAILQGFFRRHHKSKLKHRDSKSESSNASIVSSSSRSTYRLSTENENHALLEQIYKQAEAHVTDDSKSCVSQYAWRLFLATEQELMFDG